jgi:hypothetical protein
MKRKMKTILVILICITAFFLLPHILSLLIPEVRTKPETISASSGASFDEVEDILTQCIKDSVEWQIFTIAVAMQESRCSATARNGDAIGFLQITPICVEEANRILGKEQFTLEDRWSKERSVEIWHVIQNHHNPDHDHDKALDIWNPNHPDSYKDGVQLYYNQLTSQKES